MPSNTQHALLVIDRTAIELVQGDLTEIAADAIVNAANRELKLGSGVEGAIRAKGGPEIQAECDALGPIATGDAVMTGGGRLAARHVIHAVGPRWGEGDEDEKLGQATRRSLALAEEAGLKTIAFPAISTGVYGFPMPRAAEVMLGAALAFVAPGSHLERITFCLAQAEALATFERALAALAPGMTAAERRSGEIQVLVRCFAAAREATGESELELALPAGATAGDALTGLAARFPGLRGHLGSLRLAVNLAYVPPDHPLANGDEVALIPPTCGG